MKNVYKIFTALFLTLNVMPVMAGEYKIPDNEKPKVTEHQEIVEAQDANDIILAAVGLRKSSTTPSTGSTSSRVDNNASNGSTTSTQTQTVQTQHVTTKIQPEPEPTTPNLPPTNGQPMDFSAPAKQVDATSVSSQSNNTQAAKNDINKINSADGKNATISDSSLNAPIIAQNSSNQTLNEAAQAMMTQTKSTIRQQIDLSDAPEIPAASTLDTMSGIEKHTIDITEPDKVQMLNNALDLDVTVICADGNPVTCTKGQTYNACAEANKDIFLDKTKEYIINNCFLSENAEFLYPDENGTTSETKTKESCKIDNALLTRRNKTGECYVVTCKPGYKHNSNKTKCVGNNEETNKQNRTSSDTESSKASPTNPVDKRTNEEKQKALDEKQAAYDEAKANEQSTANLTLTAATTAATGIGGMELAQGLAEKKADKDAEQNMTAYLATFRCKYGDAEPVKAGPDEIELPGGNDANMMKYRNEYFTLANDLKERKTALGMNPGIESQEILDKSQTGLYDDESVGITSGAYASLYRAQMLNSEQDQQQIDGEKKKSKNRVIAGAVVGGVGVVGGAVGDSLINGKLGEKIKEKKETEAASKENQEVIDLLIKKLTKGGITNAKDLDFSRYNLSGLRDDISEIDPAKLSPFKGRNASQLINTSSRTTLANSLESLIYNNDFQQNFDKINQKNTRNDFFRAPSNNPTPTINFTPSSLDINMFDSK